MLLARLSRGPRQQLASIKELTSGWWAVSLKKAAWGCRVLGWESLVLNLGQWWEPRFGVRNSPAVWPFIFLTLSCLISEMGMAPTPYFRGLLEGQDLPVYGPHACVQCRNVREGRRLVRGGSPADLEGKVGKVNGLPGSYLACPKPPSSRAHSLPRPWSAGAIP